MELPTSIENCHRMIRELLEENATLRKSGDDFGHLAERLSLALREARRAASEQPLTRKSGRNSAWQARATDDAGTGRWSQGADGLQGYAAATPSAPSQRRAVEPAPRTQRSAAKWIL
jgi:hypothetical protein